MDTTMRSRGGVRSLARHYVEMVVAMVVGMATLYPVWAAAVGRLDAAWLVRTEIEAIAMATAMAVPMAGWMVLRGHGIAVVAEMCLAMYAGFIALFPFLWAGLIGQAALLGVGHVAMLLLMALVMVHRPEEYTHRH